MIIDILGYRDWAKEVYKAVSQTIFSDHTVHWHDNFEMTCYASCLFAVGWSEIIPLDKHHSSGNMFVLHPSPLPKYRGGSPIQHQLLEGEKVSAVTIFKLDEEHKDVDSGPICWQMPFSLEGNLDQIFERIIHVGSRGILTIVEAIEDGTIAYLEQDETQVTQFRRRDPKESQILHSELDEWPAWKLDAKIRGLQDPYPNAFITCADGNKLFLTGSHLDD